MGAHMAEKLLLEKSLIADRQRTQRNYNVFKHCRYGPKGCDIISAISLFITSKNHRIVGRKKAQSIKTSKKSSGPASSIPHVPSGISSYHFPFSRNRLIA